MNELSIPRKRQLIVHINDNCDEPFAPVDLILIKAKLLALLHDYDVEITHVEAKDVVE